MVRVKIVFIRERLISGAKARGIRLLDVEAWRI
jgi:hypothetical protein